jgi:general secretion pathway protein G
MVSFQFRRGFTLIELLVVLAIVATLLALSLPRYSQSVDVARERVLVENLRTTRGAIDKFYADTLRYPESLEELVERRYLRAIPIDPILESDREWRVVSPPSDKKGQVGDIKSSAPGQTLDGRSFSDL